MSETHAVSDDAHVPARMASGGFSPINQILYSNYYILLYLILLMFL